MTVFQKEIVLLIKSAIDSTKVEISNDFDWTKAIEIGRKHRILPLIYYGAVNSKIALEPEIKSVLKKYVMQYLSIDISQRHYINLILNSFEQNSIAYMPLKGILLKGLYPKSEMRYMCDADILIKEEQYDRIIPLLESLGFIEKKRTQHELVWAKGNIFIELHRRIFDPHIKVMYDYYGDGWKYARKEAPNGCRFSISDEDNFVYLFSHFTKHFTGSGIGMNHIIDLYVFLKKNNKMNEQYIISQFEKMNLIQFYYNILDLISVWFNGKKSNNVVDIISDKIFFDGSHGSRENMVLSYKAKEQTNKEKDKFHPVKKVIYLVFPKYSDMCNKFYVLKKHGFLLPVFWIWRIILSAFKLPGFIIKKRNRNKNISEEKIDSHLLLMKKVGLDFEEQL